MPGDRYYKTVGENVRENKDKDETKEKNAQRNGK